VPVCHYVRRLGQKKVPPASVKDVFLLYKTVHDVEQIYLTGHDQLQLGEGLPEF